MDRTTDAVTKQIQAMGCDVFEVGLFKPTAVGTEPVMLPRTWDVDALVRSISWLRHQNRDDRNIYIRPKGEHNLSLVDDLKADDVQQMKQSGFEPALVVQTSPGNFQAWLKHPQVLTKEISTSAARELAKNFGGDPNSADWRHFGRLAGYTNRKEKYKGVDGLYPFVLLIEHSGIQYSRGSTFISGVTAALERDKEERKKSMEAARITKLIPGPLKCIESFRANPRYGGDSTRVDLAYALYALSRGADISDVSAALRSRDLSHKGTDKRQEDYIQRTIQKALGEVRGEGLTR